MATKNLKKVIRKVFLNAKEKDPTKRSFNPLEYPKNWQNVIDYLKTKDERLAFNNLFKPLVKQIYMEDLKVYVAGGHKISTHLKKALKANAKQKAKEIAKAQIALKSNPAQQSYKEQESVLAEG